MAKVLEGRYAGKEIMGSFGQLLLMEGIFKSRNIATEVADYQMLDEAMRGKDGAANALLGTMLLGPIGLLGGLTAAKKKRLGLVTWTDGSQSVLEIKDKSVHSLLIQLAARHNVATSAQVEVDEIPATRATKTCPMCAEEILVEAKKCRFCGEYLNE